MVLVLSLMCAGELQELTSSGKTQDDLLEEAMKVAEQPSSSPYILNLKPYSKC